MTIINAERLILRNWQESDAEDLYNICLDSKLRQAGITFYSNVNESLNTIRYWMKQNNTLAIIHKRDNKVIGFISLSDMNRYNGYKELEYAIACDYRNSGYATEALKSMLSYAFDELDLSVAAAWVRSHNEKSVRVLEKCGFIHEGTLRRHARDKSDTLCYSVLKDDWVTKS